MAAMSPLRRRMIEDMTVRKAAMKALQSLRSRHRLDPCTDPLPLAARAATCRRLQEDLRRRRLQLAEASEGVAEAELRAEAACLGPDALAGELHRLHAEIEALQQEVQQAASAETEAFKAIEALRARAGIGDAAQRRQDSALEVSIEAERWLTLRAAQVMLDRAIERYRAANEHPLLRRPARSWQRSSATIGTRSRN